MPNITDFYKNKDISATSVQNKVVDERHECSNTANKLIVPKWGSFFKESLVVYSVNVVQNTRVLLIKDIDYVCTDLREDDSSQIGKDVYDCILITKTISSVFFDISYQYLGGSTRVNRDLLFQAIQEYGQDTQLPWVDLIGKPIGYIPSSHLHDSKDLYGLEYFNDLLDNIKSALDINVDTVKDFLNIKINDLQERVQSIKLSVEQKNNLIISTRSIEQANAELSNRFEHLVEHVQICRSLFELARIKFENKKKVSISLNVNSLSDSHTLSYVVNTESVTNGTTLFVTFDDENNQLSSNNFTITVNSNTSSFTISKQIRQQFTLQPIIAFIYNHQGGELLGVSPYVIL